jgi:hypothetical protein
LEERVGCSGATLRKVNERTRRNRDGGPAVFVCEWGRLGCNELIELGRPESEAVRAYPHRFVLVKGHELPEFGDLVASCDGCVVVEKGEDAVAVAGARGRAAH